MCSSDLGVPERPKSPSNGFIPSDPPRLVAVKESVHIRETVIEDEVVEELEIDFEEVPEKNDGVGTRAKLPSWDDIMFGSSKPTEE